MKSMGVSVMHDNKENLFALHAEVNHEPNPAIILENIDFSESFQTNCCIHLFIHWLLV